MRRPGFVALLGGAMFALPTTVLAQAHLQRSVPRVGSFGIAP